MANKRYDQFSAGTYDTTKIFLQADAITGALEKVNLPTIPSAITYSGTTNRIELTGTVFDIASTYIGQSSLTTLGTITTGTWNGTKLSESYGGTNQSTYSTGDIIYASAANTLSKLTIGSAAKILQISGGIPTWQDAPSALGYIKADGSIPLTANWNMGAFNTTFTKTGATAATIYDAYILSNTTPATVGNQQWSPALHFIGQGWKTIATAASQSLELRQYLLPVQGGTTPTANFIMDLSINGGAFTTIFTLGSTGSYSIQSLTVFGASSFGGTAAFQNTTAAGSYASGRTLIGTTNIDSFMAINATPATAGVPQQYSGMIRSTGTAWDGTTSRFADFSWQNRPVNGTVPITASLWLMAQINATGYNDILQITNTGRIITKAPLNLKGYTVAGLPAGNTGDTAYVTDALAPTFLTAVTGGGAIVSPVFYNGTNWITF